MQNDESDSEHLPWAQCWIIIQHLGDIISIKSGQTSVETYSSVQTVKYWFNSHQTSAMKYFEWKDVVHDPVDPNLCRNPNGASVKYHAFKKKKSKLKNLGSKQQARAMQEKRVGFSA